MKQIPATSTADTRSAPPDAMPPAYFFLTLLGSLMALTSLSTDIYLPAMPQMQRDLAGDPALTITGFLIGFGLAQLVWGPISDRMGRRRPLCLGMILFVLGTIGCALSRHMGEMVIWRVFQALGACTGPMLARAMVRDRYERLKAAEMLSTLTVIMAIAPIIGPLLGGQIILFSSWHTIFWLLAGIGIVMLAALRWLSETHPETRRATTPLSAALTDYLYLLRHRAFMRNTLSVAFFYLGAYAFIAGSPDVYINHFHISEQHYGWLFAVNIVGLMAVSLLNRRLVSRFRLSTLLQVATAIAALSALLAVPLIAFTHAGLWVVAISVFIFFSTNGMIAACATAMALDYVPERAGAAAALIGALQYGSGIFSSLMLTLLHDNSGKAMIGIMALSGMGAFVMAIRTNR